MFMVFTVYFVVIILHDLCVSLGMCVKGHFYAIVVVSLRIYVSLFENDLFMCFLCTRYFVDLFKKHSHSCIKNIKINFAEEGSVTQLSIFLFSVVKTCSNFSSVRDTAAGLDASGLCFGGSLLARSEGLLLFAPGRA